MRGERPHPCVLADLLRIPCAIASRWLEMAPAEFCLSEKPTSGAGLTEGLTPCAPTPSPVARTPSRRSEEHTSELQSLMRHSYAVFCLKKKKTPKRTSKHSH